MKNSAAKAIGDATGLDPSLLVKITNVVEKTMRKMANQNGQATKGSAVASTEKYLLTKIRKEAWQELKPMLPNNKLTRKLAKKALDAAINKSWSKFREKIMNKEEQ